MTYEKQIMNIPVQGEHDTLYKIGHRDARHEAARIAMEADARIADLEERLRRKGEKKG